MSDMFSYLDVEDGKIHCGEPELVFPCTREGCLNMGKTLCDAGVQQWMNSSSVHHPTEYGGEDIDVETIIDEGYMNSLNEIHDKRINKVAEKTGLTPEKVKDVLKHFEVILKPEAK